MTLSLVPRTPASKSRRKAAEKCPSLQLQLQIRQRMLKQNKQPNTRLGWTSEQQSTIKNLYQHEQISSWITISALVSQRSGFPKRTPKQCRQRYNNYIKTSGQGVSLEWTKEENCLLFDMYYRVGSKWVEIAKNLPGRSQNYLKNRFYGSLRKFLNLLNRTCAQPPRKIKPIKYGTLTKILERREQLQCWQSSKADKDAHKFEFCEKIREDIIMCARNCEGIDGDTAADICVRAHQFNIRTRLENMARSRNFKSNKKRTPYLNKKKSMTLDSQGTIQQQPKQIQLSTPEADRQPTPSHPHQHTHRQPLQNDHEQPLLNPNNHENNNQPETDLLVLPSISELKSYQSPSSIFAELDEHLLQMLGLEESVVSIDLIC